MLWEGDGRELENVFVAPKFGIRNHKYENFLKGTFASCSGRLFAAAAVHFFP